VKDRQAQEQRRLDIELLEAKRQQRKLNFLITQTELYAHFMARKMAATGSGATIAATSSGRSATASDAEEILNRLNSDVTDERVRRLDDYDEAVVKEEALHAATLAAQRQEANRVAYERQVRPGGEDCKVVVRRYFVWKLMCKKDCSNFAKLICVWNRTFGNGSYFSYADYGKKGRQYIFLNVSDCPRLCRRFFGDLVSFYDFLT